MAGLGMISPEWQKLRSKPVANTPDAAVTSTGAVPSDDQVGDLRARQQHHLRAMDQPFRSGWGSVYGATQSIVNGALAGQYGLKLDEATAAQKRDVDAKKAAEDSALDSYFGGVASTGGTAPAAAPGMAKPLQGPTPSGAPLGMAMPADERARLQALAKGGGAARDFAIKQMAGLDEEARRRASPEYALNMELKRTELARAKKALESGAGGNDETPAGRAIVAKQLGLDPTSDEYRSYVMTGKLPREDQQNQSATDKKAIFAAEDELPALENTITSLNDALKLNNDAFDGFAAGWRANVGAKMPDWMVPDFLADKDGAAKSQEFNNLMNMEAIQAMAASLTGATTNFELDKFVEILSNPSTPRATRERTIERMLSLANSKKAKAERRIKALSEGGNYVGKGADAGTVGSQGLRRKFTATNPQTGEIVVSDDGVNWEPQ